MTNIAKKTLKKFNHRDSLLVISLYPKKGEIYSSGISGVASYTKNVITHFKRPVVILGNILKRPERYLEKNALVIRCFKSEQSFLWLPIILEMWHFSEIREVLIQFDFSIYGSFFNSGLIITFIAFCRLLGKEVTVVSHQVILDVSKLKGHVGLEENIFGKIRGYLYNKIFRLFFYLLGLVSTRVVVLEDVLKTRLKKYIPEEKIFTVVHGVDNELKTYNKVQARKALKLPEKQFVVLFFGFVNWFKGADFFVDAFANTKKILGKKVLALIAGGESPTMKDKHFYQEYFGKVSSKICLSKSVKMTGYIAQKDITKYFAAADLVIFPYRYFMTASGVLSLVFSYKKPFIVSRELSAMFDSSDFQEAFITSKLKKSDLTFPLAEGACLRCTENISENGLKAKMVNLAEIMRKKRNYRQIAVLYETVIFASSKDLNFNRKVRLAFNYNK